MEIWVTVALKVGLAGAEFDEAHIMDGLMETPLYTETLQNGDLSFETLQILFSV